MKKKVGRPSKIDKEAMREVNISFIFIIIVLLILLSMTIITVSNPVIAESIKAAIGKLFN